MIVGTISSEKAETDISSKEKSSKASKNISTGATRKEETHPEKESNGKFYTISSYKTLFLT